MIVSMCHWLQRFLPVQKHEFKKTFYLILLNFFIGVVYCILTNLKGTLLITSSHTGAEVLPVIRIAIIFPISILTVAIYAKLSNLIKQSTIFYGVVIFFVLIIGFYGFYFYPNSNLFMPNATADWLTEYFGERSICFVAIYRYWMHVIFYVTGEMWMQLVMHLLYWSFVNQLYNVQEARRIYSFLISAGLIPNILTPLIISACVKKYGFQCVLQWSTLYAVCSGICIIMIYKIVNSLNDNSTLKIKPFGSSQTPKRSLWESIKYVGTLRYLLSIVVMLFGCGFAMSTVEVTLSSYAKKLYPLPSDFQIFTSKILLYTGLLSFLTSCFSAIIIKNFKWKVSASIPLVTMGVLGILFFLLCFFKNSLEPFARLLGINLLSLIVYFGVLYYMVTRSVKCIFDATKEIAYIPLDKESQTKGKAAVDMVGSRGGKATASLMQVLSGLIVSPCSPSYSGILLISLLISTFFWYKATQYVGACMEK